MTQEGWNLTPENEKGMTELFVFVFFLINFYWSIVALHCCVSFYYKAK